MRPDRSEIIRDQKVDEYLWNGIKVVYVNNYAVTSNFEDTCADIREYRDVKFGDGAPQKSIISFVQGAQWWEYQKNGATMWPSDRKLAEDEAEKRRENGTLGVDIMDRMAGIMGNIADSMD